MVEILQFLHSIIPSSTPEFTHSKMSESSMIASSSGRKIQANFYFHRLNVLLLRGVVGKDGHQVARKIATATASNARVNCILRKYLVQISDFRIKCLLILYAFYRRLCSQRRWFFRGIASFEFNS
jgi:hypothetical protein